MIGKLETVVLDAADITALSTFYVELAGWRRAYADAEWVTLTTDDGWRVAVQYAPDHRPPAWPDPARPQQAPIGCRAKATTGGCMPTRPASRSACCGTPRRARSPMPNGRGGVAGRRVGAGVPEHRRDRDASGADQAQPDGALAEGGPPRGALRPVWVLQVQVHGHRHIAVEQRSGLDQDRLPGGQVAQEGVAR